MEYEDDCKYIQTVIQNKLNICLTLEQCGCLWQTYSSDCYSSGWLIIDHNSYDEVLICKAYNHFKREQDFNIKYSKFDANEVLDIIEKLSYCDRESLLKELSSRYCFNCYNSKYGCCC